jgi:hypothetical protein
MEKWGREGDTSAIVNIGRKKTKTDDSVYLKKKL